MQNACASGGSPVLPLPEYVSVPPSVPEADPAADRLALREITYTQYATMGEAVAILRRCMDDPAAERVFASEERAAIRAELEALAVWSFAFGNEDIWSRHDYLERGSAADRMRAVAYRINRLLV